MIRKTHNWSKKRPRAPFQTGGGAPELRARRVGDQGGGRFFGPNGEALQGAGGQVKFRATADIFQVASMPTTREESQRPYEENVWIRAAIKAIANGFQRLKLKVYDRDPNEEGAREVDHPLLAALKYPNKVQTRAEFWRYNATAAKHDGEVVWFLMDEQGRPFIREDEPLRPGRVPATVLPVRGNLVEIDRDAQGFPVSYRYATTYGNSSSIASSVFPSNSVIHVKETDPYDITRGLGDVEGLERETDLYFQQQRAIDATLRNGGQPGGFLIYEHEVHPHELERRQMALDDTLDIENGGAIKVLDARAKFTPNPTKPVDMEYRSNMEWNRDSILAGLGVPPPVVGLYDQATYNNVDTAHREMWQGPNGILSLASLFSDAVTCHALPLFDGGRDMGYVAVFDHSMIEALQDDVGSKIDRAAEVSARGIGVSFNETLALQGVQVDAPEEGDRRWVQQALFDLDDPEAGKPSLPEPEAEPDAEDDSGEEADEEPEGDNEPEESEEASTQAPRTFDRTEGVVERDRKLGRAVARWLGAYQDAQVQRLRDIVRGDTFGAFIPGVTLDAFDESINPEAIPEALWNEILLANPEWTQRFDRETREAFRELFADVLIEAHQEVPQGPFLTTESPEIVQSLAKQRVKVSEGVTSTVAKRVRRAIADVFAERAPAGTLREVIRQALPELEGNLARVFRDKDARAATIAQTETARAQNSGRFEQYRASGAEGVEWVASRDDAVRPTHAALHGVTVQPGERFSNGLRYPGDPEGRASEVINCRCRVIPTTFRNPLDDPEVDVADEAELDRILDDIS